MNAQQTVDALAVAANAAALWFRDRQPYRRKRAAQWDARALAYQQAIGLFRACYSQAAAQDAAMEARTQHAQHRAEAWRALARGDADTAAHHRRQSLLWWGKVPKLRCGRAVP
ncbi:hypothetical protein [Roseococcus microcysteis]|uniref:hypothetical protein n=1 Tax=Roseococcus microcysteis TaxID=2771361 RepID=UPI00168A4763|nr:hypothetical protein [Roseococcus microcysteis]